MSPLKPPSEPAGGHRLRTLVITGIALFGFLAVLTIASWIGLSRIERQSRERAGSLLTAVLETTRQSIRSWFATERDYIEELAKNPQVVSAVEAQLTLARSPEALRSSPFLHPLRQLLAPKGAFDDVKGFSILSADYLNLAADLDEGVGRINPLADLYRSRIQETFAGRTVLILPPQPIDPAGPMTRRPNIFVVSPIWSGNTKVIAALMVALDPMHDFIRLCQLGRMGSSGETYAFDHEGMLVSESRFEDSLRAMVFDAANRESFQIRVSDPGVDLRTTHASSSPGQRPLTVMAAEAVKGRAGSNVDGYRDYRGVPVLGSWLWEHQLGIGLTTEIDEDEALAMYYSSRSIIVTILGIVGLLGMLAIGATLWSGERVSGALQRARDDWEQLAAERTAERDLALDAAQVGLWGGNILTNEWHSDLRANRMLGFPGEIPHDLDPWASALHPDDKARVMAEFEAAIRGEKLYDVEYRVVWPDRSVHHIVARGKVSTDDEGRPARIDGIMCDLTDLRAAEAAAREAEKKSREALVEARHAADAANRAKSDFLANMSHEIRTPMNAVIGMAHLALKTDLSPKQHDYLAKIQSSATALLGIINDILDFSKIEAGRLDLETVDFSLDDMLDNVATLVSTKSEDKQLELLFDIPPDVPRQLKGDPLRLGQILTNLSANAVKFTEKGEIVIAIRVEERTAADAVLRFSVRDTGIGMTTEQRERLFQAFAQADTSTTRKYGGTGLGLSIAKRLTEKMGGEITCESEYGKGSTFSFTARFGLGDLREMERPLPDVRGLRVLVVDDNATAREILRGMLESMTFAVAAVGSGEGALASLAASPVELVFMDWRMEGMDGFEVSQRIKSDPASYGSPRIIMVTAYGREEVTARASDLHLDGFLIKPVTQSMLLDATMQAFGKATDGISHSHRRRIAKAAGPDWLKGARCLLAEDNEINQQVATEVLEQAGLVVTVANNGQEALEAVTAEGAAFEVVLMDIQMPLLDGLEATRRIRQSNRPGVESLPIIAMTAHAMAGDREKSLEAGMNDHLTKPINPAEVIEVLSRWIAPRRGVREVSEAGRTSERKSADPSEALPGQMPGIVMESGLARVGGNRTLYRKLLLKLRHDYAGIGTEIRRLLGAEDRAGATRLAHSTKGVAGNLGADGLSRAASDLEHALRSGTADIPDALLRAFDERLDEVVAAIGSLETTEPEAPAPPAGTVDTTAVEGRLRELTQLLDSDWVEAQERLEELRKLLARSELSEIFTRLAHQMENFDATGARATAIELAGKLAIGL